MGKEGEEGEGEERQEKEEKEGVGGSFERGVRMSSLCFPDTIYPRNRAAIGGAVCMSGNSMANYMMHYRDGRYRSRCGS